MAIGLKRLGMMAALSLGLGIPAAAQEESTNRVASTTDWSVFEANEPRECWAVTTFTESVNTRDGRVVSVNRGSILLMVFYRPGDDVKGQVAFTGGYPSREGSTVNVTIDGKEFEFYTEGEWAWPPSGKEDSQIVTAMKRGSKAVVTAKSSRGTTTKDTFSLLGFTASVEDAEKRCS